MKEEWKSWEFPIFEIEVNSTKHNIIKWKMLEGNSIYFKYAYGRKGSIYLYSYYLSWIYSWYIMYGCGRFDRFFIKMTGGLRKTLGLLIEMAINSE